MRMMTWWCGFVVVVGWWFWIKEDSSGVFGGWLHVSGKIGQG
jgi:hypothetical protein